MDRAAQLPDPIKLGGSRLVVHIQTTEKAVDDLLEVVRSLAAEKIAAGFVKAETNGKVNGAYKDIYVRNVKKE